MSHFVAVEGIQNALQAVQDVTSSKMTSRQNGVRPLYSKCLEETALAVSDEVITYIQHSGFSTAMSVTLRACC